MLWDKIKSSVTFVISNKPVAAGVFLGIGFIVGYYVKLLACS